MFFREKMQPPAPGNISEPGFFSAFKQFWTGIFPSHATQGRQKQPSLNQDFPKQDCTPELRGLLDTLQAIRQRILANIFLGGWTAWSTWILIGLIVVFAISAKLAIAMILAAILAAAGAAVILVWTWRTRLSTYQTACRLDSAASLQDRVSTAIYLGDAKNPDGMIERQRGDALARIAKVDPRGLFPLRAACRCPPRAGACPGGGRVIRLPPASQAAPRGSAANDGAVAAGPVDYFSPGECHGERSAKNARAGHVEAGISRRRSPPWRFRVVQR